MSYSDFELIAAPHTPLRDDGTLHLDPVTALAAHLRSVTVDGVLVAGSTGEGPSLTVDERKRLAERWVADGDGLRVMVHVGHDSVTEAAGLARHAAEAGAAAVCAAPPSWFPIARPEQLADTCAAIASAAPTLPFFYYHIPVLSGVEVAMAPFLDAVRARVPNFAGIKFTHDDVEDFGACLRAHGDAIRMLWGIDEKLTTGLRAGAHGAVGSTYNFAAPMYRRLVAAHRDGDEDTAERLQANSVLLVDTLAARGYPAAAKAVMNVLGVDCGPTRLPQPRLPTGAIDEIRADLERIGYFDWIAG